MLPDFAHQTATKRYTKPQLLTAYCRKLLLETTYRGVLLHFEREFPERYLTFGNSFTLPSAITINRFVSKLDPHDFQTFLNRLQITNSGLALILQLRHDNK